MKKPFSKFFAGKDDPAAEDLTTQNRHPDDGSNEPVNMNDPSTTNSNVEQADTEAPVANGAENEEPTEVEAPDSDAAQADAPRDLAEALKAAQAERDEFKDQFLRARAEAENIRRRADQQRSNDRKYAVEGFARELLEVRDSLDHAGSVDLKDDSSAASQQMREGLELTLKQMDAAMEKFHVEAVAPETGDKFDPALHQAMSTMPAEGIAANHIVTAIRKGYQLHDRLLRPAMVVVASAGATPGTAEGADSGETDADSGASEAETGETAT